MISIANRTRRERITLWTPSRITKEDGHFFMYDTDKTFKDEHGVERGIPNEEISLVENISGKHEVSTNVVRRILEN